MTAISKTFESRSEGKVLTNWKARYNEIVKGLEESYFGFLAVSITITSMMGGIAAMYVFANHAPLWEFIICVIFSMGTNVAAIAQATARQLFHCFVVTAVVNFSLIITNLVVL